MQREALGLIIAIWAIALVHRKHGGLVLILLSIILLLVQQFSV